MFEHRCLRSAGRMWWSYLEIRRKVLGPRVQCLEQENALRMSMERKSCRTLFCDAGRLDDDSTWLVDEKPTNIYRYIYIYMTVLEISMVPTQHHVNGTSQKMDKQRK